MTTSAQTLQTPQIIHVKASFPWRIPSTNLPSSNLGNEGGGKESEGEERGGRGGGRGGIPAQAAQEAPNPLKIKAMKQLPSVFDEDQLIQGSNVSEWTRTMKDWLNRLTLLNDKFNIRNQFATQFLAVFIDIQRN